MTNKGEVEVSGRELDVAVAERLMNWQRVPQQSALTDYMYRTPDHVGLMWPSSVPRYSSDIAAAMQVVEKMRERKFGWTFCTATYGWWAHCFPLPDSGYEGVKIADESLCVAICSAALQAVGEEEK